MRKAVQRAIENKDNIKDKPTALKAYLAATDGKSIAEARDIAANIVGEPVFWNCDRGSSFRLFLSLLILLTVPRTREGYYHYTGGIEVATYVRDVVEKKTEMSAGCGQTHYDICSLCRPPVAGNKVTRSCSSSLFR